MAKSQNAKVGLYVKGSPIIFERSKNDGYPNIPNNESVVRQSAPKIVFVTAYDLLKNGSSRNDVTPNQSPNVDRKEINNKITEQNSDTRLGNYCDCGHHACDHRYKVNSDKTRVVMPCIKCSCASFVEFKIA